MNLDNDTQRANLLACIAATAKTLPMDASDASLNQHALLVQLRRDVEAATLAPDVEGEASLPYLDTHP